MIKFGKLLFQTNEIWFISFISGKKHLRFFQISLVYTSLVFHYYIYFL